MRPAGRKALRVGGWTVNQEVVGLTSYESDFGLKSNRQNALLQG